MKKKKNGKRKVEEREEAGGTFDLGLGLSQETKNGIWAIVCFGVATISTLAYFGKAGDAGALFKNISVSLFGWGLALVPIAFLILCVAFLKDIHRKIYRGALLGTALFILAVLALFHIWGDVDFDTRLLQGGYLGVILGYPLLAGIKFVASVIVLFLLMIVSVLIALNIPIHRYIPGLYKDEELEQDEEAETPPLKDNVIVKRGSEVVDVKAEAAFQASSLSKTAPPASFAKAAAPKEENDFVIRFSKSGKWTLPPLDLLHTDKEQPRSGDINANVSIIKRTLAHFGIDVEMGEVAIGPTVTQYTLRPAVGVKLSRITGLSNDLALALAAHPIRIEAPIPGKALVGIEVPNKKSAIVGLRDLLDSDDFKKSKNYLPLALGRDVAGFPVYAGLEKMPHMLVAGATGTGKSVTVNGILLSMLYKHSPDTLKLILVDPKRVELSVYNGIPHLITPVIVDTKKVVNALKWAVREMEKRYERLSAIGSRDIYSFNVKQQEKKGEIMPFIVIVIDELADLMASHGRDVEAAVVRLAQMARAVGIHLILSTQRPSVDVITGLIKANITSRIALQVASQIDSRTILDAPGADRLLGRGDMLFQSGDTNAKMRRVQGPFVAEEEVHSVIDYIKKQAEALGEARTDIPAEATGDLSGQFGDVTAGPGGDGDEDAGDELFGEAKAVVIELQKASASLLQRRLKVGYARAARLLDLLEERGIIGPGDGAKPREVFVGRDGSSSNDMPTDDIPDDIPPAPPKTVAVNVDDKIANEE